MIYSPVNKRVGGGYYGFMTPHAMLFGDIIRIWGGVRDEEGVSRIAYIDVSAQNPKEIIEVGREPVLDVGAPGCFDDNGIILGDVIRVGSQLRMYYVGFQHVQKVKFFAFSGLAISDDNGKTFKRYSKVPIMDRTDKGLYGRCIHTVLHEEQYKIYYSLIRDWKIINNIPYPVYDIWYTESEDGISISDSDRLCCVTTNESEYRIGRPKVYKVADGYEMYYTRDLLSKDYVIGRAHSIDGINWTRDDENPKAILPKSNTGWDSEMTCYPVKLNYLDREYLFYNGNGMGQTGVGYAVWET